MDRFSFLYGALSLPFSVFAASQTFLPHGPTPAFYANSNDPVSVSITMNGATQAIAINPGDPQNLYIATTSGGIWSTTDFGVTWTPLTDSLPNLSTSSIVFDPTDPTYQTLIAGTGLTTSGSLFYQAIVAGPSPSGLYRTTNGGSSWESLGASSVLAGNTISNIIARGSTILAGSFDFYPVSPNGGLFVSTDTGQTFNQAAQGGPGELGLGPVSSMANDLTNEETIYAAVTSAAAPFNTTALYKSTDLGTIWNPIFGQVESNGFIQNTDQTMIKVATGPMDSLAVYVVNAGTFEIAVFISPDAGNTWTQLDVSGIPLNVLNADLNKSSIAIDARNPNIVYITGSESTNPFAGAFPGPVYRLEYTNPGTSVTLLTLGADGSSSHADTRMSLSLPTGDLIVVSDGGVALRENANGSGGNWRGLCGQNLSTLETIDAAYDGNNNLVLIASQDNGVCFQESPYSLLYQEMVPGDGGTALINDQSSLSIYYAANAGVGGLIRSFYGLFDNPSLISFSSGINPTDGNQMVLNRNDPSWFAIGSGSDMYVAQDNYQFNPTLNATLAGSCDSFLAIAQAYGTQDNLQALAVCGQSTGSGTGMYYTSDATTSGSLALLTNYIGNPPTAVVFDSRTAQNFFVTDQQYVYAATNAGQVFNFYQIPSNIGPIYALEFISNNGVNALLAGGFSTVTGEGPLAVADCDINANLTNWRLFGLGLPNAYLVKLAYNSLSDVLLSGFWGRGAWTMYDVTSNFASASVLQFGLANNDSSPDVSILTGNRPLYKYGSGTLTITGDATFTGLSTVYSGQMVVNGSIPGGVDVQFDGVLSGLGNIGGLVSMASGTTLAPGNPTGTLTVGSLALQSGSLTTIQIAPSFSSQIQVTGTAHLDGALHVTQNNGVYATPVTYTILSAGSDLTTQFDSFVFSTPYTGFLYDLEYLPTSIQLILNSHIATEDLKGNNLKYANYLNTAGISSLALNTLAHLPDSILPEAVNASSPTRNAISNYTVAKMIFSVGNALSNHSDGIQLSRMSKPLFAKHDFPQGIFPIEPISQSLIASANQSVPSGSMIRGVRRCEKNGLWFDGFADFAHQDAQHQVPTFHFTTVGFLIGYDRFWESGWIGLSTGYANTSISEHGNLGSGNINSFILTPYGTVEFNDAYCELSLLFACNQTNQKRHIRFLDFDETAQSSFHTWQLMPHLGFGYDYSWDLLVLEPFVAFDFLTTWQPSFQEIGCPAFDIRQRNSTFFNLQTELGLRFYQQWEGDWGVCIIREIAAYVSQVPINIGTVNGALIGNGYSFSLSAMNNNQNLFTFGVSGIVKGVNGFFGSLSIDGEIGSRYISCEPQIRLGRLF